MSFETERETLMMFVERADRILRTRLVQNVLSQELKCSFHWREGHGLTVEFAECHEDDRDAFVLSLKLFIQNNDRISIYNVSLIIESLPVSAAVKESFHEQRNTLNTYLDSPPVFVAFGKPDNYRDLLHTFVFGDLSHYDPKLRPAFLNWMADPIAGPGMQTAFLQVCQRMVDCLKEFRAIAKKALEELPT